MKKNLLMTILSLIFALCATLGLTACVSNTEVNPPHTHVYDQKKETSDYFVSEATCTSGAIYRYSCSCGEKGTETFEGKLKDCTFVDGACTVCGQKTPTDGLAYTLLDDGTYSVAIGSATEIENIIVPFAHDGIKVTAVAKSGFKKTNIVSIELPKSITTIGAYSFDGCSKLTTINIPENITIINIGTFNVCTSLESIVFPDGLTTIDVGAFYGCSSLKNPAIPESVTTINSSAFRKCVSFTKIIIPIGVTTIGNYAFADIENIGLFCRVARNNKPSSWAYNWYYSGTKEAPGLYIKWGYEGN